MVFWLSLRAPLTLNYGGNKEGETIATSDQVRGMGDITVSNAELADLPSWREARYRPSGCLAVSANAMHCFFFSLLTIQIYYLSPALISTVRQTRGPFPPVPVCRFRRVQITGIGTALPLRYKRHCERAKAIIWLRHSMQTADSSIAYLLLSSSYSS